MYYGQLARLVVAFQVSNGGRSFVVAAADRVSGLYIQCETRSGGVTGRSGRELQLGLCDNVRNNGAHWRWWDGININYQQPFLNDTLGSSTLCCVQSQINLLKTLCQVLEESPLAACTLAYEYKMEFSSLVAISKEFRCVQSYARWFWIRNCVSGLWSQAVPVNSAPIKRVLTRTRSRRLGYGTWYRVAFASGAGHRCIEC